MRDVFWAAVVPAIAATIAAAGIMERAVRHPCDTEEHGAKIVVRSDGTGNAWSRRCRRHASSSSSI